MSSRIDEVDKEFKDVKKGGWIYTRVHDWVKVDRISSDGTVRVGGTGYTCEGKSSYIRLYPDAWTRNPFDPDDKPPEIVQVIQEVL